MSGPTLKLCNNHFSDIKRDIERKGMRRLCKDDPQAAARSAHEWMMNDAVHPGNFDAMAITVMEMYKGAQSVFHIYDGCPLCQLQRQYGQSVIGIDKIMINKCTDATLHIVRKQGL